MSCPGGCGGDPGKGGCSCWIDDDFYATQNEALAEGHPVGPRQTEGGGSARATRSLAQETRVITVDSKWFG